MKGEIHKMQKNFDECFMFTTSVVYNEVYATHLNFKIFHSVFRYSIQDNFEMFNDEKQSKNEIEQTKIPLFSLP